MLRRFQLPYLESEGYVNIRCAWTLGCPREIKPYEEEGEHRAAVHAGGSYKMAFEQLFPGVKVPRYVGVSCCAQFAATKEKIRERPVEDYKRWRRWVLETDLEDSLSGRVLEYSWHMMFGKPPVHCPRAEDCYCKTFGLCNLKCDEGSCEGRSDSLARRVDRTTQRFQPIRHTAPTIIILFAAPPAIQSEPVAICFDNRQACNDLALPSYRNHITVNWEHAHPAYFAPQQPFLVSNPELKLHATI
ncbi:predicted protein [Plenodomus lingam JN3]|uniref:Predicted protein n=1 Tax=Leptosphaeria maculans (strain JN3 / isolate v23.1.3 / race Av1-4-5-6-7-8) TaxID=985895 RepID=E5A553_LEPMJ|nr:predicted protein [Plenodomus lingam JN3]CBX98751.1 predicted protein [Plenodomus lingam JN3]